MFVFQIQEWFKETVVHDEKPMQAFCHAFLNGNAEEIQKRLTVILGKMISILDTKAKDDQKENFYHGLLLGLLRSEPNWLILSEIKSEEVKCFLESIRTGACGMTTMLAEDVRSIPERILAMAGEKGDANEEIRTLTKEDKNICNFYASLLGYWYFSEK